ncbi:hypothetical protein ColLi_05738 [Colletotrichum liriopes]|uniref:Uncharacterized protein n=1 Tax=Colletotrichum liriopes TaxID=708192 RepID=A0AA37LRN3_9PEZI|nr:hypothetical protein ColLi_05738 [Colletotrichum liriopes]
MPDCASLHFVPISPLRHNRTLIARVERLDGLSCGTSLAAAFDRLAGDSQKGDEEASRLLAMLADARRPGVADQAGAL